MKTTVKWITPNGAFIIDALMFTATQQQCSDEVLERHEAYLNTIHRAISPPPIIFPHWNVYMREDNKPFMLAYPFGLSRKIPYNVRIFIDEYVDESGNSVPDLYVMAIDIRYNSKVVPGQRKYHTLITDRYDNAKDFVSLAASAQATFHSIFREHSKAEKFLAMTSMYDSVGDYSSQPTCLPFYNAHIPKKEAQS